jgi:hypothetical protein
MNPTMTAYEPPISKHPMPSKACHDTTRLAPGVYGFTFCQDGFIFIPLIVAEHEGSGDVGRFLDRLSARCVIMDVTSPRLQGMLVRRGWEKIQSETNDYWARP